MASQRFHLENWSSYRLREGEPDRFLVQLLVTGPRGSFLAKTTITRPDGSARSVEDKLEIGEMGSLEVSWGMIGLRGTYTISVEVEGERLTDLDFSF